MQTEKMKKVNWIFPLAIVGGCVVLGLIATLVTFMSNPYSQYPLMGIMVGTWSTIILLIAWGIGALTNPFLKKTRKQINSLPDFHSNATFTADNTELFIDMERGKVGVIFSFNPTKYYIYDADMVSNITVDPCKFGSNSQGVKMRFMLADTKVVVPTLICRNTVVSMDSQKFQMAIAKADTYAQYLNQAFIAAKARKGMA